LYHTIEVPSIGKREWVLFVESWLVVSRKRWCPAGRKKLKRVVEYAIKPCGVEVAWARNPFRTGCDLKRA
jgi:hypothetical protein